MKLRIWYDNGLIADDWITSPDEGVQMIAWADDRGGITWAYGLDEYWNLDGSGPVKFGRTMPDEAFESLKQQAFAEMGRGRHGEVLLSW
jgi:hypothetical protein